MKLRCGATNVTPRRATRVQLNCDDCAVPGLAAERDRPVPRPVGKRTDPGSDDGAPHGPGDHRPLLVVYGGGGKVFGWESMRYWGG